MIGSPSCHQLRTIHHIKLLPKHLSLYIRSGPGSLCTALHCDFTRDLARFFHVITLSLHTCAQSNCQLTCNLSLTWSTCFSTCFQFSLNLWVTLLKLRSDLVASHLYYLNRFSQTLNQFYLHHLHPTPSTGWSTVHT